MNRQILNATVYKIFILVLLINCGAVASFISSSSSMLSSSKNQLGIRKFHTERLHPSFLVAESATDVTNESSGGIVGGDSSIQTSIFNLAKSIIGAGVLSLPSGVAFFADQPKALIPASAACAIFGLAAAYSFSSVGKVCQETKAKSFQEAWGNTVSKNSAWFITGSITAMCFLASLTYSIIIGDSFTSLAETFNLPPIIGSRNNVILALTAVALMPLCSLKNLSSLSPFSLLGLSGTLYTAIFMGIRLMDKSYLEGGKYFTEVALKPLFNARGGYELNHLTFVLLSMLSTSYIAHYNAPKFYNELKNPTMARFNTVVYGAFGSAILFFIFMMCTGFLTFGGNTLGFILNNYASSDSLATFARLAIGLALLTGYPFTFSALRDGIFDIFAFSEERRKTLFIPFTMGLLSLVTLLALVLKDVGFVVSISGALFGCMLMFVVPAVMNLGLFARQPSEKVSQLEKIGNYGMIGTGVAMAILGVYVSVMRQLGKL